MVGTNEPSPATHDHLTTLNPLYKLNAVRLGNYDLFQKKWSDVCCVVIVITSLSFHYLFFLVISVCYINIVVIMILYKIIIYYINIYTIGFLFECVIFPSHSIAIFNSGIAKSTCMLLIGYCLSNPLILFQAQV